MADRNWEDKAIGIVGRLGDKLSDIARRSTTPATKYLEPRLRDIAKTTSDVSMQMIDDPEIIFGQETGQPLLVDVASGLIPLGSMAEHAATGTDPGLIDGLDALPMGGSLAALGKAGFFALAKAERKEILSKIAQLMRRGTDERDKWLKVFNSLPEAVQNSWLSQFADIRHPAKNGGDLIRKHTDIGQTLALGETGFSPSAKRIDFEPRYQNRLNVLFHEGGHGMDDVFNTFWTPRGMLGKTNWSSSGLVDEWYHKMPSPSKELADADDYYSVPKLRDLIKQSKELPAYTDAGFTQFDRFSPLAPKDEFSSAVHTINQGLHNMRNGIRPIDPKYIVKDQLHGLDTYYNKAPYPETLMSTEGVAKMMELMPFGVVQKSPVGKRFVEVVEDNPAQYFDLDFNPFVGKSLKDIGKKKK